MSFADHAFAKIIVKKVNHQTQTQYQAVIDECKSLFLKKARDYGTSWRIMRLPSITDQIMIKAQRIRSIQEKGKQEVPDDIRSEFVGILNYCIIALIQMSMPADASIELSAEQLSKIYQEEADKTFDLLLKKNHDYDEAWREMRVSSMTDIILMKLYRTKQIEDHQGKMLVSEGVEANYRDMINYAVFCLIKWAEES